MSISISDAEPFLGIDPAIWAAIIGAVVAILAAGLSAAVVVWQIGRQAQAAIEQNRDNERLALKVKMYEEEIVEACEHATDAHIAFTTYARLFLSGVQITRSVKEHGQPFLPPAARWPQLHSLFGVAKSKSIEFVCFVERWGIIDSRLDVFRWAFNVALFDLDRVWNEYSALSMRLMPMEHPKTGEVLPWDVPSDEALQALSGATESLCEAVGELTAYTSDFQVEMQNLLLGDLFHTIVPPRQPLDPKLKVVTLAKATELTRYFKEETPWAESNRATAARVRSQIEARE